jgi:hypothetical protein
MIVWGGVNNNASNFLDTGGRYDPGTNSWIATSRTNAPSGRDFFTAVWTGSEMIVWGGIHGTSELNTGGRYDPGTNTWIATSTTNAPVARRAHTAVWTGSEMIVWGGTPGFQNTGGRYCAQPRPTPTPTPTPTASPTPTPTSTPTPTPTASPTPTPTPTPTPIPIANPTFDPPWGGLYYMPLTITLACATEGTTIYYSLEKMNDPPTHWAAYPSGGVVIPAGVPLHHSLYAQAKLTADSTKVSQIVERIYHTR